MSEERDENVVEEREDLLTAEEAVEEVTSDDIDLDSTSDDVEEPLSQDKEVVERAKKYGHLSKEEWIAQGRDPDQWKTPEEFDKTGKILEQVYALRKQVETQEREFKNVISFHEKELKKVSEREFERAKQELEQRLASARDDMDIDGVEHYKEELVKLNHMEQQDQAQKSQNQIQQAEERFLERNQHWYNDKNPDLVSRAYEVSAELKQVYPNANPDELAQLIEKRMKFEHPERVLGQVKARPAVSPSQSSVNKTAVNKNSVRNTFSKLSQEHKDTFNVYKRINPNVTEAEFIERLKKDGEL